MSMNSSPAAAAARGRAEPVGPSLAGDVIVIPLTFGSRPDWARNVRAADGCSIRLRGRDYTAVSPEFLTLAEAAPVVRAAFSPVERASFRLLGIKQVVRLRIGPPGPGPA